MFETPEERNIWSLHTKGMGIKRIQGILEKPIPTEVIHEIIQKHVVIFNEYLKNKPQELLNVELKKY